MKYTYTGAFGNSPDFQAKAAAWYQSGTECIFGCGGPDNVFAACEATGGDCGLHQALIPTCPRSPRPA